jgi:hypothetical protein
MSNIRLYPILTFFVQVENIGVEALEQFQTS